MAKFPITGVRQGFVVSRNDAGQLDFDLQSAWSPRMRKAFFASGADGLVANYARGFLGHDLEFVRELPLRRLNVLARTIRDLSPIYDLGDTLQKLSVQAGAMTRIDLSALPHLQGLSCNWDQVAATIGRATRIEKLYLGSYSERDLTPVAHLTGLRSLGMKDRPAVRSLDGVESMPALEYLGIFLAPLEDTSALACIRSSALVELALEACRKISSLSDLSGLVELQTLNLAEIGTIESIAPLSNLRLLESLHLHGSTKIEDGDLTPILDMDRIRNLSIMNRSHYRPSVSEVKASLGLVR